jgi:hypothetical protein
VHVSYLGIGKENGKETSVRDSTIDRPKYTQYFVTQQNKKEKKRNPLQQRAHEALVAQCFATCSVVHLAIVSGRCDAATNIALMHAIWCRFATELLHGICQVLRRVYQHATASTAGRVLQHLYVGAISSAYHWHPR